MMTINCSAFRNEVHVFQEVGRRHLPGPVQESEPPPKCYHLLAE